MRTSLIPAAVALVAPLAANASPLSELQMAINRQFQEYSMGFRSGTVRSSQSKGGRATCISGMIDVTASGINHQLNLAEPVDQSAVTNLFLSVFQAASNFTQSTVGKQQVANGTYGIASQFCFPGSPEAMAKGDNKTTVQLLVHGAGVDRTYWDAAPNYSYVDYAAEQGFPTLFYDRLGSGDSNHPDALQTVQLGMHVAIAHEMARKLRTGAISNRTFAHVVGVGHSLGSATVAGVTAQYPNDFDAAVLTGFPPDPATGATGLAGLNLHIASQVEPVRFTGLSNGYLTSANIAASQFFFFRAPAFAPALLRLAEAGKGIFTVGELLTSGPPVAASFTGPVDVVNGDSDFPICGGNCAAPTNQAAGVRAKYFPNAKPNGNGSDWYLAPGVGHALNYHFGATDAYKHIHNFLQRNGF